jgi:hypothetical protein
MSVRVNKSWEDCAPLNIDLLIGIWHGKRATNPGDVAVLDHNRGILQFAEKA